MNEEGYYSVIAITSFSLLLRNLAFSDGLMEVLNVDLVLVS